MNYSVTLQSNPKFRAPGDRRHRRRPRGPRCATQAPSSGPDTGDWISDAQVAETTYTLAFESSSHKVTARLVVRRVKERNPAPPGQEELFPLWRHHAFLTDTTVDTATSPTAGTPSSNQVFADLIDGPLAHLPSGRFAANAAWLTLTAGAAHNLLRAVGSASPEPATAPPEPPPSASHLINVPARLARRARRPSPCTCPNGGPGRQAWQTLWHNVIGYPIRTIPRAA